MRTRLYRPQAIETSHIHRLSTIQRVEGLSIQSLFLAAVAQNRTPEPDADVILGTYLANRSHAVSGLDSLAAPTVNVVPIRAISPLQRSLVEVARQMQEDLHSIGSVDGSLVSLAEIESCTGIKVECIVNFLRLPEGENDNIAQDEQGVSISQVKDEEDDGLVDVEWDEEPRGLGENLVKDAYIVSCYNLSEETWSLC